MFSILMSLHSIHISQAEQMGQQHDYHRHENAGLQDARFQPHVLPNMFAVTEKSFECHCQALSTFQREITFKLKIILANFVEM